jgi:MFS family permease
MLSTMKQMSQFTWEFFPVRFFGAHGLSNPFWDWISDRQGRRRPILLLGALGGMTGYLFFGLSRSFTWV